MLTFFLGSILAILDKDEDLEWFDTNPTFIFGKQQLHKNYFGIVKQQQNGRRFMRKYV